MRLRISLLFLFNLPALITPANNLFCPAFSVISIYQDTTNLNSYWVSMQCIAPANEIFSYPFVPFITDCNGDTVATGNIYYFGQLGQSTQDYPVTLTGNGSINCFPLLVDFIITYGPGIIDTCQYYYSTTGIELPSSFNHAIRLHPNPASDRIILTNNMTGSGCGFVIYDQKGRAVSTGRLHSEEITIELTDFQEGVYWLKSDNNESIRFVVLKD